MTKLTIIGNGYTAQFLSKEALKKGINVSIITRNILEPKKNIHYYNFDDSNNVAQKLAKENIISTVPPNENGLDPIIKEYKKSISLNDSKIIYFSATSVYGSGIIDEETKPEPQNNRGTIRLNAEKEWLETANKISIFRISGIYGPKRHPMIKYVEGNNKIIIKDGYIPNRIHVEDLCSITIQFLIEGHDNQIINISDQNKVNSYDAIKYVAKKLELQKPEIVKYNPNKVSKNVKSFYEVNRTVKCKVIEEKLKYKFKHPDYKKALLRLTKQLITSNK